MKKRQVFIELKHGSYFVFYAQRAKGGRYMAGQFYAPDHTLQSVEQWVRTQPKLELIEPPKAWTRPKSP